MKRRSVFAALALLAALPVLAAGPGGGGNRLEFLAGYLSLTDQQKTQAQAIFDAADAAAETARGQMTAATEALQTAVKANRPDSDLDQLAAAVGVIHGQSAAIRAKASAKFYALLTTEQKTKYDAMGERGGARGPGRR